MREYRVMRQLPVLADPAVSYLGTSLPMAVLERDELERYYAKHDPRVGVWIEERDAPPWTAMDRAAGGQDGDGQHEECSWCDGTGDRYGRSRGSAPCLGCGGQGRVPTEEAPDA